MTPPLPHAAPVRTPPARPAPARAAPSRTAPSLPAPAVETEVMEDVATEERIGFPWKVILFNDEIHTFDEVIFQVIKATGCAVEHAEGIAWTVHTRGKAVAYEGEFAECFRVQGVLREIGLVTQIEG